MTWSARRAAVTLAAALALTPAASTAAYDPLQTFNEGAVVLSVEGGGGKQLNFETARRQSDFEFWNAGLRVSLLPFGPAGPGPLFGALEVGLEPFYQRYTEPTDGFFAGLAAVFRYHFLSLGRFVPYVEVAGAAGGTDVKAREIDSEFSFLIFGGAGASFFVADRTALYAGYRYQHVSNGNVSQPNRGFESHTGVAGVSFFFE